jgi:hypothetical protein
MSNKTTGKVENAIYKVYQGCGWLLINLFFLGFLCWGLYLGFVGYRVEANGEVTEGYVADLDLRDGGTYTAIFEFEVNGETYSFRDDTSAYPPKYELGETVTVRYDRSNPNLAHIDGVLPAWLFPSCMVILIVLMSIFINVLSWRAWKRREEIIDLL